MVSERAGAGGITALPCLFGVASLGPAVGWILLRLPGRGPCVGRFVRPSATHTFAQSTKRGLDQPRAGPYCAVPGAAFAMA